ncbi:OmpA family protein [Paracoccus sp. ME4]|uniref:OmpA family protein n=1 Tax=Paracoccus sp. ME4 TaxID=3138066 RepID=UPI00398BB622
MSRNPNVPPRRAFLMAGGAAVICAALASPIMAGPQGAVADPWIGRRLTTAERARLAGLGASLDRKFSGSDLKSVMLKDHVRLRIPAADLFFAGKDALSAQGVAILTLVAEGMTDRKGVRVEVVAHHDLMAPDYDSWIFTRRRAEAARAALMSRGVEAARIRPTGLGGKFPYLPDGRDPHNQRLELLFRPL